MSLTRTALTLAALALPAGMGAQAEEPALQPSLQQCLAITADAPRLACYDRLAGYDRFAGRHPETSGEARPPAPTAAPPTAPAAPPPPAPVKQSFGLYSAEHPVPLPVAPTLKVRVVALGRSPSGHMTATVEGGGLWELDEADPVLAVGDSVTIERATLGSFLMNTPEKRIHRVRRLH